MSDPADIQIYVVDDDPSVRKALEMLFISAGMKIRTFKRAAELLEHEIATRNACLVTDLKMSGLSGLELQQQLIEQGIDIPVIFLTAHDSKETRQRARQAGAAGYFRKPIDDRALLDAIHWALSRHS